MGKQWKQWQTIFLGNKITAVGDCSHEIKICLLLGEKAKTNLDSILKSIDITLPRKVYIVKTIIFPIVMYGCENLDHKERWALKNWCFWAVVLETHESLLECKEIKPVSSKENQSWIFIGRTDAEVPKLWSPDVKSRLIRKDPDAAKDWRLEEKGTEDEMVGWHHQLNGHEFEQALGDGEWQGILACYSP